MENKIVLFDGESQYFLEIKDGTYRLYHNHSECWVESVKGTLAFEMINDGNQYKFKSEKKGILNYSEAVFLYIILALEKDYKVEVVESIREL